MAKKKKTIKQLKAEAENRKKTKRAQNLRETLQQQRDREALERLLEENRDHWEPRKQSIAERLHEQNNTQASPEQMLKNGHNIIINIYNSLIQDYNLANQFIVQIDQWQTQLQRRIRQMDYHFSWLKEEKDNNDNETHSKD